MFIGIQNIQTIVTATTLGQARKIMHQQKINVVTLDMQLPDGSGIHFLKWIKEKFKKTHVIILSNYSDPCFRSAAKKYGADYFLDKSTEFEQIPKILSKI